MRSRSLSRAEVLLAVTSLRSAAPARSSQTLEIKAADLASLGARDLNFIHIADSAGKEVLCQAIDADGDELHKFDAVIFHTNFAPDEITTFTATAVAAGN